MTYIADLERCSYFDRAWPAAWTARLIAVGWLEPWAPFSRGDVPAGLRDALARLLEPLPWTPIAFLGSHSCGFCRPAASRAPASEPAEPTEAMLAAAPARGTFNLFVPALARVYVAPSLVSHYIDAHGYLPPPAFLDAVQQCPPMRSDAYRAGLRASLGDGLDELDALDRQLTDWARASGYLPPAAT